MPGAVSAETLRHSWELITPQLQGFVPPAEAFDPAGAWSRSYRIATVHETKAALACGQLKLQRTPQASGARLEVEQELRLARRYSTWTKAAVDSTADRWSTPRRFTVDTWVTDPEGKIDPAAQGSFTAEVAGPEIRYSGSRRRPVRVAAEWTLDWTLLDALQRLPLEAGGSWQLDLVEDGDLLRPRQRLDAAGPVTVSLAGKPAELYAFCHTGVGTLPTLYWLDAQHRLLAVSHYYRAFILESGASKAGAGA